MDNACELLCNEINSMAVYRSAVGFVSCCECVLFCIYCVQRQIQDWRKGFPLIKKWVWSTGKHSQWHCIDSTWYSGLGMKHNFTKMFTVSAILTYTALGPLRCTSERARTRRPILKHLLLLCETFLHFEINVCFFLKRNEVLTTFRQVLNCVMYNCAMLYMTQA